MKLWNKGKLTDPEIMSFTIGKDRELDMEIAGFDIIGSIAHVIMLESVNLLSKKDKDDLTKVLLEIYDQIREDSFTIQNGFEDVHSQVEKILTDKLGETGKKIHTARSRNDQVMVDLKLYYRFQLSLIIRQVVSLIGDLLKKSESLKNVLIPGYTHLQAAMPSSFGLWFGAFAESLTEDIMFQEGILEYINQNPLGSAAGYGSSFPIDRDLTTRLLEFNDLHVNSINAQFSRGKTEKLIAAGLGAIAGSLGKMSMDMTLFMSQNYEFLKLGDAFTTGSSIMPHKKNPDAIELIRGKTSKVSGIYTEVLLLTQNLPSGYHRDFQLLKEILFPGFRDLSDCISMMIHIIENLEFSKDIIEQEKYNLIFSVENINEKVMKGSPFRDAYNEVAGEIENGSFRRLKNVEYRHIGSIGNLSNDRIVKKLEKTLNKLDIERYIEFNERFIKSIK
jgi:argininosuccinate lyase